MKDARRRAQWRQARARARELARQEGRCIVCLSRPVAAGRATCEPCSKRASAAKQRQRALTSAEAYGVDLTHLFRNADLSAEERLAKAERALRLARDLRELRAARRS